MNLRRIICEELEAESFKNLVDLIKTKDIVNISLALQIAKANKAGKQFEVEFGVSFKDFTNVFNKIILPISKQTNLKNELDAVIDNILDAETLDLDGNQIVNILSVLPSLFWYFDTSILDGWDISNLISYQPKLVDKVNLKKMNGGQTDNIVEYQPQLRSYFDKLKKK